VVCDWSARSAAIGDYTLAAIGAHVSARCRGVFRDSARISIAAPEALRRLRWCAAHSVNRERSLKQALRGR